MWDEDVQHVLRQNNLSMKVTLFSKFKESVKIFSIFIDVSYTLVLEQKYKYILAWNDVLWNIQAMVIYTLKHVLKETLRI